MANHRGRRAGNTGSPAVTRAILAPLVLSLAFSAVAPAGKRKPLPPPPADVAGHVNYLARQLTGVQVDDAEPVTSQIQKLVLDDVEQWLNAHPPVAPVAGAAAGNSVPDAVPYDVKVRREMDHDFSLLHYPFVGQPAVFAQPWPEPGKGGELVGAGYMLGWTDQDQTNLLAFFEVPYGPANPESSARPLRPARLAAVTPFAPGCDLHYAFPAPPGGWPAGEFVVLVYGTRLGKSHPRLSATLYAFDGQAVKSLWQTEDVYDGELVAERDRIVIRHLKEQEFVQAAALGQAPPRYEAVYRVTSAGVERERDKQVQ